MLDDKHHSFITSCLHSENYQVSPIAGDASSRLYYRVVHENQSYVLMAWEAFTDIDSYPFLNVQKHFSESGILVPNVVGLSPENGLVLLEDLGDLTLERKFWEFHNQEMVLPYYKQAIDELIKIQFKVKDKSCVAYNIEFDLEKLLWEMNYGKKHLIKNLCAYEFDDAELVKEFKQICQTLADRPKHICHRDYHSRNLMIKLGRMRVIDFQDARLGPIQYDLVSLLDDSYVNINSDYKKILIDDYLNKAKEHLWSNFSRDEFDKIYTLQMIQRCFKACGSFSSFYNSRTDRRYLKYIKPTINKVYKTLTDNKLLPHFQKILVDSGALEKSYTEL